MDKILHQLGWTKSCKSWMERFYAIYYILCIVNWCRIWSINRIISASLDLHPSLLFLPPCHKMECWPSAPQPYWSSPTPKRCNPLVLQRLDQWRKHKVFSTLTVVLNRWFLEVIKNSESEHSLFFVRFFLVSWVPSQIEHLANQLVGTRSQSATLLQRSSGPSSSCQAGLQLPTREAQVMCISRGEAETGLEGHWGSYVNISSCQYKAGESQLGKTTHWQEIWVRYVWFWIFAIEAKLDAKLECKSITWQHHPKGHKQQ